jgi:hypothetical protein
MSESFKAKYLSELTDLAPTIDCGTHVLDLRLAIDCIDIMMQAADQIQDPGVDDNGVLAYDEGARLAYDTLHAMLAGVIVDAYDARDLLDKTGTLN